jgi:hypothetical protein
MVAADAAADAAALLETHRVESVASSTLLSMMEGVVM